MTMWPEPELDRPGRGSSAPDPASPFVPWCADAVAVAIAAALAAMVLVGATGTLRVLLAVAFVSYVPGRAVVANWPGVQARSQVALPVVLSLSIVSAIAVVSLWAHAWSPMGQFVVEAALSVLGIAASMLRRARANRRPSPALDPRSPPQP